MIGPTSRECRNRLVEGAVIDYTLLRHTPIPFVFRERKN